MAQYFHLRVNSGVVTSDLSYDLLWQDELVARKQVVAEEEVQRQLEVVAEEEVRRQLEVVAAAAVQLRPVQRLARQASEPLHRNDRPDQWMPYQYCRGF